MRINNIKNAADLLKLFKGSIYMLDTIVQGGLAFGFFSRGPLEWALVLKKEQPDFTVEVYEVNDHLVLNEEEAEFYDKKIHWHLAFLWDGKMEEFVQAVENLLVQSPYHKMGIFKKGTLG